MINVSTTTIGLTLIGVESTRSRLCPEAAPLLLPRHSVAPRSHAPVYQIFFCERRGPFGLGVVFCERHGDCIFFSAGRPIRVKLLLSYSAL
jgi:hypothetical protein